MDPLSGHVAFTGGIVTKWRRMKLKVVTDFTLTFSSLSKQPKIINV